MSMKLENVIVGSGPTAYICALELIRNGENFTVITPKLESSESSVRGLQPNASRRMILKDRFSKPWVYGDDENRFKVENHKTDLVETAAFGGLSNVWGAVCFPNFDTKKSLPFMSSIEIESQLIELKKILRINESDSTFWSSAAPKKSLVAGILRDDFPPIARSVGGGHWNAQDEWRMLDENYVRFQAGFVSKVSKAKNGSLLLDLKMPNSESRVVECRRVFIACGPFGNARIILNSCSDLQSIGIEDSSVSYKIFFDIDLRKRFESTMEAKRLYLYSHSDAIGFTNYLQVYSLSEQLIQSFRFKRLHFVLRVFARIFAPFFSVGITFMPGSESSTIFLTKNNKGDLETRTKAPNRVRLKNSRFSRKLMGEGLISLPLTIKGKPGAGVHSGAFLNGKYPEIENSLFQNKLQPKDGVHFLGTSNLSFIPAGPVTILGLVHSLNTTRKVCVDG